MNDRVSNLYTDMIDFTAKSGVGGDGWRVSAGLRLCQTNLQQCRWSGGRLVTTPTACTDIPDLHVFGWSKGFFFFFISRGLILLSPHYMNIYTIFIYFIYLYLCINWFVSYLQSLNIYWNFVASFYLFVCCCFLLAWNSSSVVHQICLFFIFWGI